MKKTGGDETKAAGKTTKLLDIDQKAVGRLAKIIGNKTKPAKKMTKATGNEAKAVGKTKKVVAFTKSPVSKRTMTVRKAAKVMAAMKKSIKKNTKQILFNKLCHRLAKGVEGIATQTCAQSQPGSCIFCVFAGESLQVAGHV